MTTQHTPGPWRVILDDTGGQFTGWPSVSASDELDCSIVHRAGFKQEYWGDLSQREAIANARLIAAAPELLTALEPFVLANSSEEFVTLVVRSNDIKNARAAITKATGGAV